MSTNHQSASNGAGLRVHIFSNVYIPCTLLLLSTNNRSSTIRRHNQGGHAPLWVRRPLNKRIWAYWLSRVRSAASRPWQPKDSSTSNDACNGTHNDVCNGVCYEYCANASFLSVWRCTIHFNIMDLPFSPSTIVFSRAL